MVDASAELSQSLWELSKRPPAGSPGAAQSEGIQNLNSVTEFYIERASGEFIDVGRPTPSPEIPNKSQYIYIGGSEDLSHLLFSTKPGFHWPFDKTAAESSPLYEYVGTGNTKPLLVGVNGGRDSEELLSECGVRLGSSEPTGGGSMYNAISSSGNRVFFTAVGEDDQACGAEEPPVDELFAREELPSGEMQTTIISEPSTSFCSTAPPSTCADAHFQGASRDGSKVFFTSTQKLLPDASEGSMNLYEYEFNGSEHLTLVSGGSGNPGVQGVARISEDGSSVYFVATGELSKIPNDQGYAPEAGQDNLYVFEHNDRYPEGHISFIATLSPGDAGDWAQEDSRPVLLSSDNSFLIFPSVADLTHEGASGSQIYQYDSQTGALIRASIGQEGYNDDGRTPTFGSTIRSTLPIGYAYSSGDSPTQAVGTYAPADGAVFFESPDALTPQALNDQFDEQGEPAPVPNVYEYHNGNVYLISDGRDTTAVNSRPSVTLIGSSASGGDVFFGTSDSLVAQDTDTQQDIYNARVEGGFPSPANVSTCEEAESCRGALSQPPMLTEGLAAPTAESAQPATVKFGKAIKAKPKSKKKAKPKSKSRRKVHRSKARRATGARKGTHHGRVRRGRGGPS
jgi:hypothetical protein